MMRKLGRIAVGAACVLVLAITGLWTMGNVYKRQLIERGPFTIEDLDRLAKDMGASPASETASRPEEEPADPFSASTDAAAPLPRRLDRVPTAEERAKHWPQRSGLQPVVASVATPVFKIGDAALRLAGCKTNMSWELAMQSLGRGDWDSARRRLQDVIETSPVPEVRRQACAELAWLEDDPEIAGRLLEMSCSGYDGNPFTLSNAAHLANLTGSDALTDHYLARLRNVSPERAQDLERLRAGR